MHQSSKSLCPSLRGVPEDSKTPPTCQVWMILSQVIAIGRKLKFSKIGLIFDFEKQCVSHFVFGCFISQILCKLCKLGVFWNPQDLLLMMGTEILTIAPEMAEIIEVEMGTFSTEIIFLSFCHFSKEGCQLQLQFSQPFLHQFLKSLCPSSRGNPEDSETPPEVKFLMSIGQENSKNKVAQKLLV